MKKTTVSRTLTLPDIFRISRYEKSPEFGPRVLFFSGGSALTETSRVLKKFTHNSIHLVTPYDSGGSSAVLRDAFDILAVGDLRSRLMALADETISGHPEVFQLFAFRLSKSAKRKDLLAQLKNMASGKDPLVGAIKNPMRKLICNHLNIFLDAMPEKFDLNGASIGNLILVAGYLNNQRQLDPVLFMFSKLVNVLGQVTPIVNDNLQLAAKLENGHTIVGQHLMTGKEAAPLQSPIKELSLVKSFTDPSAATSQLSKKRKRLIENADLICYPPGSYYTSLLANLLPRGVGQTIARTHCPKIYIPSLGIDPERVGLSLDQSIFRLIATLQKDTDDDCANGDLLNFVMIDSKNGEKLKPSTRTKLKKDGIEVLDTRLVSPQTAPYYDPNLLVVALLSLA